MQARARQLARNGANSAGGTNAEISVQVLDRVAALGEAELAHLSLATRLLGLTARSWHRVIRVARTIADLGGRDEIRRADLSEALTYRVLDRANAPRRVTVPGARSV